MTPLDKNKGFTLAELMLATSILLVAVLGLLAVFISGVLMNQSNNNLVMAVNDAQYCLEQMKALDYLQLDDYNPPDFNNLTDENVIIPPPDTSGSITTVTVTINWTERTRDKSVSLSTRFAR